MSPKKMFFTMVAILILILVGSSFMFTAARNELRKDIVDIKEKRLEFELADGELRQLRETKEGYDRYSYLRDELSSVLPQDKEQSEAIQRLVDLFAQAGVKIGGISFLGTDGLPSDKSQTLDSGINGVASLPIDVTVPDALPYDTAIKLLRVLENSERHLNVETFGLSSTSGEGVPDGYVNVSLSVNLQLKTSGTVPANPQTNGAQQ